MNRTLVRLLEDRSAELQERYGIAWQITGVASRRIGWIADPSGLNSGQLLALNSKGKPESEHLGKSCADVREWLAAARADVLFESTSLNIQNGQPAVDHIRAALEHGAHAITANKGTIVHAYRELRDLAHEKRKRFLFESTVMDGVPVFALFRDALPALRLRGFHGILNSTTNLILSGMEKGLSFETALKTAQDLGIAETDAAHDIDGWDAAVKTAVLVNVLMDEPLRLIDIEREGIRNLTPEIIGEAGRPYKLVCRARRSDGVGHITASVRPEQVALNDPMAQVSGTSSYIHFESDIFPGLAITENNPGLYATAYGLLSDFIRIAAEDSNHGDR